MWSLLKKILHIQGRGRHYKMRTETLLFSGSAYFSNRVPKAFIEEWVAHGGEISSGTTLDVRARYFFATGPSDPWVAKLFSKSVMVIHAGWIVHCVDEAFQVPIAEYILDDCFVPGPPYKLTTNAYEIYAPLSETSGPVGTETDESGRLPVHLSDAPSTPPSMPRKRKREQAYFDSPSGSLVFSGFDKDGMPRRPRKLRKLRFDPSFSPKGGRPDKEAMRATGPDWLQDHHGNSSDSDGFSEERGQLNVLHGLSHMATARAPDTPDKPLTNEGLMVPYRRFSVYDYLPEPTHVSSPAVSIGVQEKTNAPPVRTIDFTNLPPPTRRWRFPEADTTISAENDTMPSITRPADHMVKTPKKISFADHARICVYTVSPRPDGKDSAASGPVRQCLGDDDSEDGSEGDGKTLVASDKVEGYANSSGETINSLVVPQTCSLEVNNDPLRRLGGDQFENDTLALTVEEVQAMRHRLLHSVATNAVDDGELATLFELGKTFRGMGFRHVW